MPEPTLQDVADAMKQFSADARTLDARYQELLQAHPKQWAGMHKGELWVGRSLEEVIDHFDGDSVVIKYLDPDPKVWVLVHRDPVKEPVLKPGWLMRQVELAAASVREWEAKRAQSARPVQQVH